MPIPIARLVYEAHVEELPEGGCVIQTSPERWDAKSLLVLPPIATECPLSSFAPGPGGEAQSYMLRELAGQGGTAHRRDLGAALYGADTRRAARRAGGLLARAARHGHVRQGSVQGIWELTTEGRAHLRELMA